MGLSATFVHFSLSPMWIDRAGRLLHTVLPT